MSEHNRTVRPDESEKQESNGVGTGMSDVDARSKAAALIEETAPSWRESAFRPSQLLRAVSRLSLARPEEAGAGFTARELADEIAVIRQRVWLNSDLDKEDVSDRVREHWNILTESIWKNKLQKLWVLAEDNGWIFNVKPDRTSGGGSGNQTRYFLRVGVESETSKSETKNADLIQFNGIITEISYVREDFKTGPSWFGSLMPKVSMGGPWRLGLFIFSAVAWIMLALALIFSITLGALYGFSLLWTGTTTFLIVMAMGLLWSLLTPIFQLPTKRICIAPTWLQLLVGDFDALIEWCAPPRYPERSISTVRYVAVCPLCDGKVYIEDGGLRYFDRLIGRCRESPREHLYSFDHVRKKGILLNAIAA